MSIAELQPTPERARATYTPTLEQAREFAHSGYEIIPVYRELVADLETPPSAFLKLYSERQSGPWWPSFLFESVEVGEKIGRYSFLGIRSKWGVELPTEGGWIERRPDESEYHKAEHMVDPLRVIEPQLTHRVAPVPGLPRFFGGFVGYLGFECEQVFLEHPNDFPSPNPDSLGVPDAILFQVDNLIVFDHILRKMKVISNIHVDDKEKIDDLYNEATDQIETIVQRLRQPLDQAVIAKFSELPPQKSLESWSNLSQTAYEAVVATLRQHTEDGEFIQTVGSRRIARKTLVEPFKLFRALRQTNPSPFMFFIDFQDFQLIGASPELLVKVEGGKVSTWPIAGTRGRGKTTEEDLALINELVTDPKERAEHLMLLDLGRNDIGRVSKPGTVKVPRMFEVETFSSVHHMTSEVEGDLRDDLTSLDALRAIFPAGTVSGAPKIRAIQEIYTYESDRRGPYAGAVGFINYGMQPLEFAITIRTIVMKGGIAYIQVGGGIVYDSKPPMEHDETVRKALGSQRGIDTAEQDEF